MSYVFVGRRVLKATSQIHPPDVFIAWVFTVGPTMVTSGLYTDFPSLSRVAKSQGNFLVTFS